MSSSRWSGALSPWALSLVLHAGLAALLLVVPAEQRRSPPQEPIEVVERKPAAPPPKEAPPPPATPAAEPRLAMTKKIPKLRREPPPEPTPPKPVSKEQPPEAPVDTGPKIFGAKLSGTTTAAPGQGVAVPEGDSLRVSPQVVKRGKAPPARPSSTGFKQSYGRGEEAPLAVLTTQPRVLAQVTAEYPERMKELGIEGKVVLELVVDATGKVTGVRVVKSLHAELDAVASAAARRLRFAPATVGGTPVQTKIPYTFTFVLD